jgi:hypothetical protein
VIDTQATVISQNEVPARVATAIKFGSVLWVTDWCPKCGRKVQLHHAGAQAEKHYVYPCCGIEFDTSKPIRITENRICTTRAMRRGPSAKRKRQCLKDQSDRCLYCIRRFGSYVYAGDTEIKLKLAWDHFVPFVFSGDNSDENFVAACHICNGWKSDLFLDGLKEYRDYLNNKWLYSRYSDSRVC